MEGAHLDLPQCTWSARQMTQAEWRSRTRFVLAALGAAIGFGNIWHA